MATSYIGRAALTLVRVGGTLAYVYAGTPVPDGASAEEIDRLVNEGYIVPVPQVVPEVESPAKSASKADWEAFARSQGATDADLDGQTKDDLIAAYGD